MRTIIAWSFLFVATPCTADTITVNWDGSGDYTTIQAGINAALIIVNLLI